MKLSHQSLAWVRELKQSGYSPQYLIVLKFASLKGLSFDTFGRECERVTPRSISNWETFFEVIEVPPSTDQDPPQQGGLYVSAVAPGGPAALAGLLQAALEPVLTLIASVTAAAEAHGRWVGVCGELAGDPDVDELFLPWDRRLAEAFRESLSVRQL